MIRIRKILSLIRQADGAQRSSPQHTLGRDRGTILIAVSFVGIFAMALSSALISHFAVSEARGVADSLAKLRVYWAMVGHVDYALSRMRQDNKAAAGWLSDLGETGIQGVLLGYLDELDDGANCRGTTVASTTNSKCSSWPYVEVSSDYVFHFKWTVYDPFNSVPVEGTSTDGRLGIRIDYVLEGAADNAVNTPTSSVPSLDKLSVRLRDLEYEVCFVQPSGPPIGNCSTFTTDLGDASGASRIDGVRRCQYGDGGSPGTLTGTPGSKTDNTSDDSCI